MVNVDNIKKNLYSDGNAESAKFQSTALGNIQENIPQLDYTDFSDAYFHGADLRGIDFRNSGLEGASLKSANISGCYFPRELRAEEIQV